MNKTICIPSPGIKILFNDGNISNHGKTELAEEDDEDDSATFTLKDGEMITRMRIRHAALLDQLTFYTNKGQSYGPYGGKGGREEEILPPAEFTSPSLAWINGTVVDIHGDKSLKNVQFGWVDMVDVDTGDTENSVRLNNSVPTDQATPV